MIKTTCLKDLVGQIVKLKTSTGTEYIGNLVRWVDPFKGIDVTYSIRANPQGPYNYMGTVEVLQKNDEITQLVTLSLSQIFELYRIQIRDIKDGGVDSVLLELGLILRDDKWIENGGYAWKLSPEAKKILNDPLDKLPIRVPYGINIVVTPEMLV